MRDLGFGWEAVKQGPSRCNMICHDVVRISSSVFAFASLVLQVSTWKRVYAVGLRQRQANAAANKHGEFVAGILGNSP